MGESKKRDRRRPSRRVVVLSLALVAATVVVAAGTTAAVLAVQHTGVPGASDMPWPADAGAVVALDEATVAAEGADEPRPLASIAKLVTALVVLDAAPLAPGEAGASYTMDSIDELIVGQERESGGAAIDAPVGSVLTERQMLEAMLVASSNNHARSLTRHVFGDEGAFLAAAEEWLARHDLASIRLADATGMSPETTGSPLDVLALARIALANPVIAEVGALPSVTLQPPAVEAAATYATTNDLLGRFGVDGLKTGTTDAAGHSVVFTAPLREGSNERLIGVILGSPTAADRDTAAAQLLAHVRSAAE